MDDVFLKDLREFIHEHGRQKFVVDVEAACFAGFDLWL